MAREAIMKMMACNIGWCKEYEGDDVHGDHGFIRKTKGDGSERWNFRCYPDGKIRGYFRGIREDHHLPRLPESAQRKWTIIFYARDPHDKHLKVIGYYRRATILAQWEERPERVKVRTRNEYHVYCVVVSAKNARLFPEQRRPLFGKGVGQAGFIYLTDPHTQRVRRNY